MDEIDDVKKRVRIKSAEARIESALTGTFSGIPHCTELFFDNDLNPIIQLSGSYLPQVPDGLKEAFNTAFGKGESVTTQLNLDDLLMYLCDVFDRNPRNNPQYLIGTAPSKKGGRDIYLTTETVVKNVNEVGVLLVSILQHDFLNGKRTFGEGFYDVLLKGLQTERDAKVKKVTQERVKASRERLFALENTGEYEIADQVREEFPSVTTDTLLDSLTASLKDSIEKVDKILDDMVFARLGIYHDDRQKAESERFIDPRTGLTVLVKSSEDGLFDVEFAYEFPSEITQLYLRDGEGAITILTPDQKEKAQQEGFLLEGEEIRMTYHELRSFLFSTQSRNESLNTSTIKSSKKSGAADITGMKFPGGLRLSIPPGDGVRSVDLVNLTGSLTVEDASAHISLLRPNLKRMTVNYARDTDITILGGSVTTLDALEGNMKLDTVKIVRLSATRSHMEGPIEADNVDTLDCTGSIVLINNECEVRNLRSHVSEEDLITIK